MLRARHWAGGSYYRCDHAGRTGRPVLDRLVLCTCGADGWLASDGLVALFLTGCVLPLVAPLAVLAADGFSLDTLAASFPSVWPWVYVSALLGCVLSLVITPLVGMVLVPKLWRPAARERLWQSDQINALVGRHNWIVNRPVGEELHYDE